MKLKIKHYTEDDIRKFKEAHPKANPKEWGLVDEDGLTMGFFDTWDAAKTEQDDFRNRDLVENGFRDWAAMMVKETGIDREKIAQYIKEFLL